jgi:hypothetical protein
VIARLPAEPLTRPRLVFGLVAVLAIGCTASPTPAASRDPEQVALDQVRGVTAQVEIGETSLLAAAATADFGIEEGLRAVRIRVVDEMVITVNIGAETDVVLAEPPGLCLVGPFWNPLDAGLSDRCWGDPDLTAVSGIGTTLHAEEPAAFEGTIARGHERCDYAPGEWTLEVSLLPVVGGRGFGPVRIPDVIFTVPIEDPDEPLELLSPLDTRVCSYSAAVVSRQGEPEVIDP